MDTLFCICKNKAVYPLRMTNNPINPEREMNMNIVSDDTKQTVRVYVLLGVMIVAAAALLLPAVMCLIGLSIMLTVAFSILLSCHAFTHDDMEMWRRGLKLKEWRAHVVAWTGNESYKRYLVIDEAGSPVRSFPSERDMHQWLEVVKGVVVTRVYYTDARRIK